MATTKKTMHWIAGFSLTVLTLTGCQTLGGKPAEDEKPFVNESSLETVVILGTNDIHGALAPETFKTKDAEPVSYERGGASIFASHLKILRSDFGSRLIWLDAGDQFQGSIDSNLEKGKPMVELFNSLGLDAAAVGNHEFDFGPAGAGIASALKADADTDLRGALKERISEARYPYLAANVFDKKGKPGVPGTKPSTILKAGNLKIGVIGLSTLETPVSTRPEFVKGLEFKEMAKIATAEAKSLREQGAHIVLAVAHAGVFCNMAEKTGRAIQSPLMKKESTLQSACVASHEVPRLIRHLPSGTIDGIVSGHTHSVVHHWIDGIPVIQAGTRLQYYNLMYLTYDWKNRKVVTDRSRIEGPIPVCPKVFENQNNCNGDQPAPADGRGTLETPTFRGRNVYVDSATEALLRPTFQRTEQEKKRVVGKVNRKIEHIRTEESPLGNLVADAVRAAAGADVAIVNSGGIRANFEAGDLRFEDVFRTLPFDNFVSVLNLKGSELLRFIRIAESGARGYFPTSGLRLRVIDLASEAYAKDLDGNRKIDLWEMDRLLEARLEDGSPIEAQKIYKVATIDFLIQGGDSFGWFMDQIPKERIQLVAGPFLRDAVIEHIAKIGQPLNSETQPLVNPAKPRLVKAPRPSKKPKDVGGKAGSSRSGKKKRRR